MSDLIRPYGFLLVRYWQRDKQTPEVIISPEDILSAESITPSDVVFGASEAETSTIRLRNDQDLVLCHLPLLELTKMLDEAMRERSNMRMPLQEALQEATAVLRDELAQRTLERDQARRAAEMGNGSWIWGDDGDDDLSSLSDDAQVSIRAETLRKLLQSARDSEE